MAGRRQSLLFFRLSSLGYFKGKRTFSSIPRIWTKLTLRRNLFATNKNEYCKLKNDKQVNKKSTMIPDPVLKNNADNGDVESQYRLGMYFKQEKDLTNEINAKKYLQLAADQNHQEAIFELGKVHLEGTEGSSEKAYEYLNQAVEQNHLEAPFYLGNCYFHGIGVKENKVKAAECYHKAAINGVVDGMYRLAECYKFGHGVKINLQQALFFFSAAANRDHPLAKYQLALYYKDHRNESEENMNKFKFYIQAAAEHKIPEALFELGVCYKVGIGFERDDARAFELFFLSSSHNYPPALYYVGLCYYLGEGTHSDLSRAQYFFILAHEKGFVVKPTDSPPPKNSFFSKIAKFFGSK